MFGSRGRRGYVEGREGEGEGEGDSALLMKALSALCSLRS